MYTESPRIIEVTAHALGATTLATHAVIVREEVLGISDGDPNQVFYLQNRPVLALREGEAVQVEEKRHDELVFVPWQRVSDFSQSDRYNRHFTLDTATGELRFGPAIRQPEGMVRQYGRIPEAGRAIRFSQYRYGGGVVGNVPAGKVQVLKSAIPYIDQVTNLSRAAGGRDQENLEEAKLRARRELRAQLRAVTPEDYEDLAKQATRTVARVKCNVPQGSNGRLPPGMVEILIVPSVIDALRVGDLTKLAVDADLVRTIDTHLDSYRLLTTTLQIREPRYVGLKVHAEIVPAEYSLPEVIRARVVEGLRNFINPLPIADDPKQHDDLMDSDWEGWPFGRDLYVAEIFSLIQRIPGVKHVLDVQLSRRPVTPNQEVSPEAEQDRDQAEKSLTQVKRKVIHVPADTLLCSLDHEIELVELGEEDD
jgi:predicted phage baseplate assembly protein